MAENTKAVKEKFMRVPVEVTKTDIRRGKREEGHCCMVNLALRRVVKDREKLWVGQETVELGGLGGMHAPLPKAVTAKIKRWDDGGDCKPFSFKLRLPVSALSPSVVRRLTCINPNARP